MITYKHNAAGTVQAAYLGQCRIGYVEVRQFNRWRWQLSLVMPGGGNAFGVVDDETSAKEDLSKTLQYWMTSAGLTLKEKPHVHVDEPPRTERELRTAEDTDKRDERGHTTGKPRAKVGRPAVRKRGPAAQRVR